MSTKRKQGNKKRSQAAGSTGAIGRAPSKKTPSGPLASKSRPSPMGDPRPPLTVAVLLFITAVGMILRLTAIQQGLPNQYIPDESTMVGGALRMGATMSIQPSTFIYPAMMMYVFAAEYAGLLVFGLATRMFASVAAYKEFAFVDPTLFYLIPRITVALIGTATIPLIYLVGRRLYGRLAGLVAATLLAASVMHVQMSHQARHWVPVTFLTLIVLWVALDLAEKGRRRDYLLSGVLVGVTAATSFNGFLLGIMPLIAHLVHLRKRGLGLLNVRAHVPLAVCMALIPIVFFALNPYIALDFNRFVAFHSSGDASIGGQIRGHYDNYLQQFLEKQGFTFFAEATIAYEPLIALLGISGAVLAWRSHRSSAYLVVLYPIFHYLMFATTSPSMEQRYMLPGIAVWALPAALAGAEGLKKLFLWLAGGRKAHPSAPRVSFALSATASLAVCIAFLAALPSIRYDSVLAQSDTRTQAQQWIEANLPAGSDIAVESYPPPITADLDTLRAQQAAEPRSLGARDQWLLEKGLPEGEIAYKLTRLNLVDTSPTEDKLTSYLETHRNRYYVVSDYHWKSDHKGHQALKAFLTKEGKLIAAFPPGSDPAYIPSDVQNNMEDPLVELWKVDRSGPLIQIYEAGQ